MWIERAKIVRAERDSGKTWKQAGLAIGTSPSRAQQLFNRLDRHEAWMAYRAANPPEPQWHDGLNSKIIGQLIRNDIACKQDCDFILQDNLVLSRGRVVLRPLGAYPSRWDRKHKTMSIAHLNELREFLGVKPYVKPVKIPTESEISRAKKMLESSGYTVFKMEYKQ